MTVRTRLIGTVAPSGGEALRRALSSPAAALVDLLEVRLDTIPAVESWLPLLLPACVRPAIATCRRAREGGRYAPESERERLRLLRMAVDWGAEWVDVEADVPDEAVLELQEGGAAILRSDHLPRLPDDLDAAADRLLALPGDAVKLIAWEGDDADVVRALDLQARHAGRIVCHVVSRPVSRVLGALVGARFAYASLRRQTGFDFPMPTVRRWRREVQPHRSRMGTRAFLLLGSDVHASVSPDFLNAAFEELGQDVLSVRWSTEAPEHVLAAIERFGWLGAAVTRPHKRRAAAWLRERGARFTERAAQVGAVNTALWDDGGWTAEQTDLPGVVDALFEAGVGDLGGAPVVVLGAGGAARAGVMAGAELGGDVSVVARNPERAQELVQELGVGCVGRGSTYAELGSPAVLIDATPAGPPGGTSLVEFDAAESCVGGAPVVLDMLVAAQPTALLAAADEVGATCVPGFEMLLHQAAHQIRAAFGVAAPLATMREVGLRALSAPVRRIVLLGLRASGKSTLGAELARAVGFEFLDTDELLTERMDASPDALIRSGREDEFRRAEAELLVELSGRDGVVVATGGGAALHPELVDLVQDALVVHLDAPDAVLLARLDASPRAALTGLSPVDELARQRAERGPALRRIVEDARSVVVDTGSTDAAGALDAVLDALDAEEQELP